MADQPSGGISQGQWNQYPSSQPPKQNGGIPEQSQFSEEEGMRVNVTPRSPIQPSPSPQKGGRRMTSKPPMRGLAIIAAIIVVVAIAVLVVPRIVSRPLTTITTTTIPVSNVSAISSCQSISKPGSYYLSTNIEAQSMSGACISIDADNVSLICNQNRIAGHGPYSNATPYSYGIYVNGTSHDTVSSCEVSSFSYGIFASNAPSLTVVDSNVSQNSMADIYLSGAPNASIGSNYLAEASSSEGALHLGPGSRNANVYNNTIVQNVFAGVYVNSTGNSFTKNYINSTPASFQCAVTAGFSNSSRASLNTCDNNFGCDFIRCSAENVPLNFSQITLNSQVRTCGSIEGPGIYSLQNGLSLGEYVPGLVQNYTMPCITIKASGVTLDCNGWPISGAQIGISASAQSNLTINDCRVLRSGIGMSFTGVQTSNVTNSIFANGSVGLQLSGSGSNQFSKLYATGLTYGVYMRNSTLNTLTGFNTSFNGYGLYLNGSLGNVFNKGVAQNNSRMDVYATNDSANASYDVMQSTSCGLTDAAWAPCSQHVSSTLNYYPINSCMVIRRSGNYTLTSGIVTGSQQCFDIRANDVKLSCAGFGITQLSHSSNSTAVLVRNASNIEVSNCAIDYFRQGVLAINSTAVSVLNSTLQYGGEGIALNRVLNATVAYDSVAGASSAGISMKNTYFAKIHSNNVTSGKPAGTGISINSSMYNNVYSNLLSGDQVGMLLSNATNNTIKNNTAQLNGQYDYSCDPVSSGFGANQGGINYGTTKNGCTWIAAIEPPSLNTCTAFLTPSTYQLTTDMVYPSANLCYGIYSNSTTINCMGHTVLATHGGTFALFKNVHSGIVENCNLKGFSSPIRVVNSSVRVINNTIYSNVSSSAQQASISVQSTANMYVAQNNITTISEGIAAVNVSGGQLIGNRVSALSTAFIITNTTALDVRSNYGTSKYSYGLQIGGSQGDTLSQNIFNGTAAGIACLAGSNASTSMVDGGQNYCSSAPACQWISSSSSTC